MKHEPENHDPQLSQLLKTWRVDEPLPPRFLERVWKRIEAADPERADSDEPTVLEWLRILFARPAFAAVCAALLLVAGLTVGFVRANQDSTRINTELAHRYVAAVDPYADRSLQ